MAFFQQSHSVLLAQRKENAIMLSENFSFRSEDGTNIFVYRWSPKPNANVRGIVQIAHGMAETAKRYERFASFLTENGYIVYANDHRGHGKTAGSPDKVGYLADDDGFDWLVKDMYQLTGIIKKEYTDLPVFLFGHSMGSFAAQKYLMLYGRELSGAILSGSNGKAPLLHNIGLIIAAFEVRKNGRKAKSKTMHKLIFGSYNKAFKPNRTEFDWLSRDNDEVDTYINDPYCGGIFTAGFYYDFMKGLIEISKTRNIYRIPKDLPVFIFSGDKDPVGGAGKGVNKLYQTYRKAGLKDITIKLYPGSRHEMLNEINREEVMKDATDWMNDKASSAVR
jgi:alpha-beta hydrolase superfamily lysophospholipase